MTHQYTFAFVPNTADDRRCFQASYRMMWQRITGETLPAKATDEMTGWVSNTDTWPHAGMLAAAGAGMTVTNLEDFDPEGFIEDPVREVARQVGDKDLAVSIVRACADIDEERDRVRRCLAHPSIEFVRRSPDYEELARLVDQRSGVIVNVNNLTLQGSPGYNGHFVLVTQASPDVVVLQNPGLPPVQDQRISRSVFERAWRPEPGYANIIAFALPADSPADPEPVSVG